MGMILDLNPRLQAAHQARGWNLVLVAGLTNLAVANLQLALFPLLMIVDALGATRSEDPTR